MSNDTRRTVRGFLMASAAVLVLAGPALAQDARHSFNIPAGDAVTALQAFAKQSGKQVLFPFEAASGKRTPAVTGDVADADALAKLAKAAGLVVASDDGKTITLRQATAESSPQLQSAEAGASTDEAQLVEAVVVVGSPPRLAEARAPTHPNNPVCRGEVGECPNVAADSTRRGEKHDRSP